MNFINFALLGVVFCGSVCTGLGLPQDRFEDVKDLTSTRIVGGWPAPENSAPHMVALMLGYIFEFLMCGGSIISEDHVITAGHCIQGSLHWDNTLQPTLRGVLGSNKYTSTENIITFKDYIIHPEYSMLFIKNDLGVLITSKKIIYSPTVAPIAMSSDTIKGGEICSVTGWGDDGSTNNPIVVNPHHLPQRMNTPEELQLLHVFTLDGAECERRVLEAFHGAIYVDSLVEICTFLEPGRGMCFGDSGGPVVLLRTGELVGLVSWGSPCARGYPDMHARISGFYDTFLRPILNGTYQR